MTGDRLEAEDAVQEAFARPWHRWRKVSGHADPEVWVRTVACRLTISSWRKALNRSAAHRRHGAVDAIPGLSPDYVAIIAVLRQISPAARQTIVLITSSACRSRRSPGRTGSRSARLQATLARGRRALRPLLADGDRGPAVKCEG